MFITFEGPEGSGKSTHSKKLKSYLEDKGKKVLLTREPGGTQVGKNIRELLLDAGTILEENTEVYLFAADRSEHVGKVVLPALAEGKIVISDRFTDSTLAYQIGGRGLPEDFVRYLNMVSARGLIPNLTILLDVKPEVGLKRAARERLPDRFEKEREEFHRRVREKYLEISREEPERVKIVETSEMEIDEIQGKIRQLAETVLIKKVENN